jgi:dTDP-glucose 4,6-dehydratase
MAMAYHRAHGVKVRIARIFNTYGPRMRKNDGRAVPEFIDAALRGKPLPVFGTGRQTRSLCYVDDEVRGLLALLFSSRTGPMNIGNPAEVTVLDLARKIKKLAGGSSPIARKPLPVDDPKVRQPDIALARRSLAWRPVIPLEEGLRRTIDWFRHH